MKVRGLLQSVARGGRKSGTVPIFPVPFAGKRGLSPFRRHPPRTAAFSPTARRHLHLPFEDGLIGSRDRF